MAQSAVAKIETGVVVPRVDTLDRLFETCGAGLEVLSRAGLGVDRSLLEERLRLSPVERLRVAAQAAEARDRLVQMVR